MRDSIKFEIVASLGKLSTNKKTGWSAEVNLVSWNEAAAKLDIRDWSPDHTKMGKGVTFSPEEVKALYAILKKLRTPADGAGNPEDEEPEGSEGPDEDGGEEPKPLPVSHEKGGETEAGIPEEEDGEDEGEVDEGTPEGGAASDVPTAPAEPNPNPVLTTPTPGKKAVFLGRELNDKRQEYFLGLASNEVEVMGYVPTEEYLQVVYKLYGKLRTVQVFGNSEDTFDIREKK